MIPEKKLIYADDVLVTLADTIRELPTPVELYDDGILGGLDRAFEIIEQAPAIDAEKVIHGYWKYGTRAAICSECGFERNLDDNFGTAISCPNCRAKMDGGKNG